MRRPKVLCVTESSYLSSGYSTYTHELLKRLHKLNEFDLYEFSSFGQYNDPRSFNIPWTYISNLPNPNSQEEQRSYESDSTNKFGAWKFEEVCLNVKPDIIFSFRDFWADSFIFSSPFRDFYHFATMPTADATPLASQWISAYIEADAVFAYNDWSLNLLKEQTGGEAKIISSAPPGADTDIFKPIEDKEKLKIEFAGLPPNSLVVGAVMRNMKRKLYPDIIECFERFLKEAPEDIRNRTYLYLHTAYPDAGWDIPRLLKDYRIGHRTLFTYLCRRCGESYPTRFQDSKNYCKHCSQQSLMFSDSSIGVSREVLSKVMNCFDVCLQISSLEGFGMQQTEAASCGVPVFSVDYSAMSDVVRKINGVPIKVLKLNREAETHRLMAVPDLNDLYNKLVWFLKQPTSLRDRMGFLARKGVLEHYTYDKTAEIWANHFRSVKLKDLSTTWNSPSRLFTPNENFPAELSNEEFIRWGVTHILNQPKKVNSFMAIRLARDLNWGSTTGGLSGLVWNDASALGVEAMSVRDKFNKSQATQFLLNTADHFLFWEKKRLGLC